MLHIAGKISNCLLFSWKFVCWWRLDSEVIFPFCPLIGYCFQNRTKIWALLKTLRYRFALRNLAEILFTLKHFRPIAKLSPTSFKCVLTFTTDNFVYKRLLRENFQNKHSQVLKILTEENSQNCIWSTGFFISFLNCLIVT